MRLASWTTIAAWILYPAGLGVIIWLIGQDSFVTFRRQKMNAFSPYDSLIAMEIPRFKVAYLDRKLPSIAPKGAAKNKGRKSGLTF